MSGREKPSARGLPAWALWVLVVLAATLTLGSLKGFSISFGASLATIITELAAAAAVIVAAGGYGRLLIGRIMPNDAPAPLRTVTAILAGLWALATALLILGTAFSGLLRGWLWWPLVALGAILAALQARKTVQGWHPPQRVPWAALAWLPVAVAAGIWLTGATLPPGMVGGTDAYDILEYHLQAPREFYDAQRITALRHNCYSFYPLQTEMLFLLGMILRGGAYEGMYLAKLLHGAFGVLAVAVVCLGVKQDRATRGRFAAGLLASCPLVVGMSWLAMAELGIVAYLAAALLWMREWVERPSSKTAWCVGIMLGGACSVKYLSVGFVVAPVLVLALIASIRNRQRLAQTGLIAVAALLVFSPWLIRNLACTGNPVFPLATGLFGRGHWNEESERRWVDGHAPDNRPPVPPPRDWSKPEHPSRATLLYRNFAGSDSFGYAIVILAAAAAVMLAVPCGATRRWDGMLAGICVIQLIIWILFTRGMPSRFLLPTVVPLSLLAGGFLSRLCEIRLKWLGRTVACILFAGAVIVQLHFCRERLNDKSPYVSLPPIPGEHMAGNNFPTSIVRAGSRVLLVGDAKAFYYPRGTVYATVFDRHPLAELLEREAGRDEIIAELRRSGITHIWVDWVEIHRLAKSYGFPASLTGDAVERIRSGKPGSNVFEKRLGLTAVAIPAEAAGDGQFAESRWKGRYTLYEVPVLNNAE